jgi:hypothetical protein
MLFKTKALSKKALLTFTRSETFDSVANMCGSFPEFVAYSNSTVRVGFFPPDFFTTSPLPK